MTRILIIAPDLAGIDAINEERRIQQWHDAAILHGTVTADDIYRALQEKNYEVLHFATHGGPDGIQLSGGALLDAEDIGQFVRLRETKGVFFSACQTGRLASYAVRHGAQWAVSSEVDLPDAEAWKLAAAFYAHQRNGNSKDFVGAYVLADSGDGDYALHVNPLYLQQLQAQAALVTARPHDTLIISRQLAVTFALGLLGASAALSALINLAAGRW